MTSEVLLMNLQAVALGADSARTTTRSRGDRVSINNVDKIYVINELGPIAVMTYNNAKFAGLPWRTIWDQLANNCGEKPLTFDAYSHRLRELLAGIYDNSSLPTSRESEIYTFNKYVEYFLNGFIEHLLWLGWDENQSLSKFQIDTALSLYASDILIEIPAHTAPDGHEIPDQMRPSIINDTKRIEAFLADNIEYSFEDAADAFFKYTHFPEDRIKSLMALCIKSTCVDWLPPDFDEYTGMILVGFGEDSAVPCAEHLKIFGTFGGVLKFACLDTLTPHPDNRNVIVETFAQANLTKAFLNGSVPAFRENTEMAMHTLLKPVISSVRRRIYNENKKLSDDIFKILTSLTRTLPMQALDQAAYARRRYVDTQLEPLLSAANDRVLGEYAMKMMRLPIAESGLLKNDGVGEPICILTLSRGQLDFYIDGVKQ